jgi:hypothetical protein
LNIGIWILFVSCFLVIGYLKRKGSAETPPFKLTFNQAI